MDVQKFVKQSKNPMLVVLTNPFPTQHQKMVAQVPVQQPVNQSTVAPRQLRQGLDHHPSTL
jgi:hypothetical protein